jgi:formiminotetrahydrofolate cyclodeaminase
MADSADRSLRQLLDDVAARTSAPGGGSAAAWSCALAAALVGMAARFADGEGEDAARMEQIAARADELRSEALVLADRDLGAYEPVLAALRLPADAPDRAARIDAALSEAAEPPLAIARAAAETAELALEVGGDGNPRLAGDAQTGLLLADAACRAAACLVAIDLAHRPEDGRLVEAAALRGGARARSDSSGF